MEKEYLKTMLIMIVCIFIILPLAIFLEMFIYILDNFY